MADDSHDTVRPRSLVNATSAGSRSDLALSSRLLHWFALLTAVCTFPLIFAGGLVTSTGSALAVPDWPTSYGYNMFLFPISKMVGGIRYEHTHRLIGSLVGLLTVALAIWIWLQERRRALRWMALAALIGVCVQGVIGGMRVVLVNHLPALAAALPLVHACLGQAFFAFIASIALVTSAGWRKPARLANPRLRSLAVGATALIYFQILLGALTRHQFLGPAAHIVAALLVAAAAIWILALTLNQASDEPKLTRPALLLFGLVLGQIFLGFAALVTRAARADDLPPSFAQALIPTAHVALGALILATSVVLTLRAWQAAKPAAELSNTALTAQPIA